MITIDELKEYFASIGIILPDVILNCIVTKVNSVSDCMINGGYDECDITMSMLVAGALIGISMGARKVSSQAVKGISQSFKYDSLSELQTMLENILNIYDPNGCTDSIIPAKVASGFIMTLTGCKR